MRSERPKKKPKLRLVVNNTVTKAEVKLTKLEEELINKLEGIIEDINEQAPLSDALKSRLVAAKEELEGLIGATEKNYLTQNRKMAKMSGRPTFNWAIPSNKTINGIKTCPNAAACAKTCYAVTGLYQLPRNAKILENRFLLSLSSKFVEVISSEIKRRHIMRVRIHDGGDFYDEAYLKKWIEISTANPKVEFYTYTKMISLLKSFEEKGKLPSNFTVVYSYGGKEDKLIDPDKDIHSVIFEDLKSLKDAHYEDAHLDDATVLIATTNKMGLVFHGTKKFKNGDLGKARLPAMVKKAKAA